MPNNTCRRLSVLCLLFVAGAEARVVGVDVAQRTQLLNGRVFGEAGAYEKLSGRIRFAFDPELPANRSIVDLELAPRNDDGDVEAEADFMVLRPSKPRAGGGVALLEVSNRGGKASLRYFNGAASGSDDPVAEAHFGDGLLLRQGLTVIWVGWQFDVPEAPGRLRLRIPVAIDGREPITGLARSDWVVDEDTAVLGLGHRGHIPYPVANPEDGRNVLTVRDGREDERRVVPRHRWRFVATDVADATDLPDGIALEGGFRAGHVYELVYLARDPRPVGLGLAVVRDTMAYALHGDATPFPARYGVAFGVSQTGRFLRQFLYQGFNRDEHGRRVFDGMLIHTAGAGRGSFNHRFGQPSRDAHGYSAFFYPTDLYPFASLPVADPVTGRDEGLLDALPPAYRPRVMVTNTGYEYWGRAASLIHAGPAGRHDLALPPTERVYHLAGGQHFVGPWPPRAERRLRDGEGWLGNPLDFLVNLRALLVGLVDWVVEDRPPPASRYPRLERDQLIAVSEYRLPGIAGIDAPSHAHVAYRADYGEAWRDGIVNLQPPRLARPFVSLVPTLDEAGNELGGVRNLELRVPLATYTPWSLRDGLANPGELRDFRGMILPLPRSDDTRARDDTRPSIDSLYRDRAAFLEMAREAAAELVAEGFLLDEDRARVLGRAESMWDRLVAAGDAG